MANSQGSSSFVGTGGYWNEFLNCDDSFYKIMNVLDFPMESVEGNTSFDLEKRMAQFQSLGPMTSEILHGVAPVSTSDSIPNTSLQVQIDPASSSKHLGIVTESRSHSVPKHISAGLELIVPVRNRTKIPKTSTFTKWHDQHKPGRRCCHCQAETTPLWREGPSGPKTLCNACGIRYRRLNYYPAVSSPSVATLLSNNQNQVTKNIKPETDRT